MIRPYTTNTIETQDIFTTVDLKIGDDPWDQLNGDRKRDN